MLEYEDQNGFSRETCLELGRHNWAFYEYSFPDVDAFTPPSVLKDEKQRLAFKLTQ